MGELNVFLFYEQDTIMKTRSVDADGQVSSPPARLITLEELMGSLRGATRGPLRTILLAFLLSAFAITGFLAAPSAVADEEPPPPSDFESSLKISGLMQSLGEPVPGIGVTVIGPGFTGSAVSDERGRWSVAVPARATYEVILELDTLPEGVNLREGASDVLIVDESEWLSSSITRNFGFEQEEIVTASFADQFLQRLLAGIILGSLLALASVGLSLIYGTTGISNFAHGEAVTLGGIVAWVSGSIFGLPFPAVLVMAVLVGAASGLLQNQVLWQPLRRKGLKLVQLMIVSIGLSIVLRYIYLFFMDGTVKLYDGGLGSVIELGPVRFTQGSLATFVISVAILTAFGLFLTRTRVGRATRAVSDNSALAEASGINTERVVQVVWILGSALAAISGVMLALYRQTSWLMGFEILLLLFAAVVLGGLGSAYGALIGSFIIGLVVEFSALLLPADLKYASALLILILMLVVRPQGILGKRERVG
jgi:neutral amino acid transport system permease protein